MSSNSIRLQEQVAGTGCRNRLQVTGYRLQVDHTVTLHSYLLSRCIRACCHAAFLKRASRHTAVLLVRLKPDTTADPTPATHLSRGSRTRSTIASLTRR